MLDNQTLLEKAKNVQLFYDKFLNRTFTFVYKDGNKLDEITVFFGIKNFKHLTGMEIYIRSEKKKLDGKEFYEYIKKFEDFDIKTYRLQAKSYTEQKLKAMQELSYILDPKKILATKQRYATSDAGIRTRKLLMFLGLKYTDKHIFVPHTMIDPKDQKNGQLPKCFPVHCIYEIIDNKKITIQCIE